MAEPSVSKFVNGAALDDDASLFGDEVNLTSLTLDALLTAGASSVSVSESIASINVPCYLRVDSELIYTEAKSSGDFVTLTRGAGGTTAASHVNGSTVYVVHAANYHNQVKRTLIAIQEEIGLRTVLSDGHLDFATSTELTISSGSVTPTQNWHTVDTQADAASDDLDTLVATSLSDGFILFLRPNNDARSVVVTNAGNIITGTATSLTLDDDDDVIVLIYDATLTKWEVVAMNLSVMASVTMTLTGKSLTSPTLTTPAFSGVPTGTVTSGTWNPSLTNTTNIAASTAHECQYIRIGNEVMVAGVVEIDPTATGACVMKMSLPVASDFAATENASGNLSFPGANATVGSIIPDATTNELDFRFTAIDTGNQFYRFMALYKVI